MSDEMTIRIDSDEYVARRDGDDLQVGRRVGGESPGSTRWSWSSCPQAAREAIDRGDTSDEALLNALRGIVSGRGGARGLTSRGEARRRRPYTVGWFLRRKATGARCARPHSGVEPVHRDHRWRK